MADGIHLANAYVSLSTSTRGLRKEIDKSLGGSYGTQQGRGIGSRMARGLGSALKVGAKAGAITAGVTAGTAILGGFRSAVSQQNAQKVFAGLYGSTGKATTMMDDLRKVSSKSAIDYDAYTSAGQSLAYAGIQGKDAVGILENVGKAIVAAGGDTPQMESAMGGVMKAVNNGGIAMMDSLSMISESGVPILSGLGEKFGKSTDQIKKMASDGKITIEDVMDVMQKGTGDTFQSMIKAGESANKSFGNTFKRIKDNAFVAIGSALVPMLDKATPALERFGGWLESAIPSGMAKLSGAVSSIDFGSAWTEATGSIRAFAAAWKYNDGEVTSSGLPGVMERVGYVARQTFDVIRAGAAMLWPHIKQFGSAMAGLWPQVKQLASAVGSFLMAAFRAARPYLEAAARVLGVVLVAAMKALPPILSVVMSTLRGVLAVLKPLLPVVAAVAAAYGGYRLALLGIAAAQKIAAVAVGAYRAVMVALHAPMAAWTALKYSLAAAQRFYTMTVRGGTGAVKANTVAEKIGLVVGKAKVAVLKAMTLAQRAFNAVLRMNPIGLVITALIALGAVMVLAYKKSETFRRIVNAAWAGIKTAAAATVAWFRGTAWPWLRSVFTSIGNAAKWLWRNAILPAFRGMGSVVSWWYNNIVKRYFALVRVAFRAIAAVAKWLWMRLGNYFYLVGLLFRVAGSVAKWLWRKALVPAFRGIVAVAKWLWARLRNYFNLIGRIWRVAASVARWLWQKGIRPAFQGIARLGSWLWGRLKASFNFIRGGFRGVQRIARWLWDNGIRPTFNWIADKAKWLWGRTKWAFDRMKAGMTALKDRFATVRDQIGRIWDRLKGKITGPVKSAIKWLQSNFVGKLNSWMGKIPGVPKKGILGKIPVPKGWASGGYTGRGSKYDPAGIVHRDEFVVQKSSRRRFERENPGALDHLNRTGTLPGYRIGGKVAGLNKRFLDMLHAFNAAAGGRYTVNSGYRSNAHQRVLYNRYLAGRGPVAARPGSSQHNKGLAADLAPSNARDVHGGLARSMGLVFTVPSESWHIEPSWGRGSNAGPSSGGGGGGFGLPGWVSSPIKYVKDKIKGLTDKFDPSKFGIVGKTIPAVFNKIKDAVTTKVKEAAASFVPDFLGGGGGGNVDWSDIKSGPNKVMGKMMAERYGWTGAQWSALKVLWEKESNWNHRARNPSSGAHGIPQSLPASKMRSEGADYLTNPKTQIAWGLKYIRGRYGNPGRALAFHHRNNWYADGGLVRPAVFDNGGTLAPGVNVVHNKTGKPEPLIRPEAALSGPVTVNVVDRDGTLLDRIRGEIDMADRHAATRTRMGAGGRY